LYIPTVELRIRDPSTGKVVAVIVLLVKALVVIVIASLGVRCV